MTDSHLHLSESLVITLTVIANILIWAILSALFFASSRCKQFFAKEQVASDSGHDAHVPHIY
jgi:hypothetical protein